MCVSLVDCWLYWSDLQVYEVVDRLCELRDSWPDTWGHFNPSNIAVVTPYQDQVLHVRQQCVAALCIPILLKAGRSIETF